MVQQNLANASPLCLQRAAKEKQELFNKGIRDLEKKIQLLT